jgi:hypothetical protein
MLADELIDLYEEARTAPPSTRRAGLTAKFGVSERLPTAVEDPKASRQPPAWVARAAGALEAGSVRRCSGRLLP